MVISLGTSTPLQRRSKNQDTDCPASSPCLATYRSIRISVPPSFDFGYNLSEYEFSDPELFDDRRPSTPASSIPTDDLMSDPPSYEHRLSISSEHEEDAVMRRRPRLSSFAESEFSPSSLVVTIPSEVEMENSLLPTTPDDALSSYEELKKVKIEEVVISLIEPSLPTEPSPKPLSQLRRSLSPLPSQLSSPSAFQLSPLPRLSLSPQPEQQDRPLVQKLRSEAVRDSSPLSDISAQEVNRSDQKSRKFSAKRRSLLGSDTRATKKVKRDPEAGPSENIPQKNARREKPSSSRKRKDDGERCRRSPSPCSSLSSLSMSSAELGECQELTGMVIETLAMARARSMDGEGIWGGVVDTRPSLKTKRMKAEWKDILYKVLDYGASKGFFGTVASSGDDHNNPLPPQYFYVSDKDPDQERAALLKSMMPRAAGGRSESVKYKQYYWKQLGKWSRWDAEEEM